MARGNRRQFAQNQNKRRGRRVRSSASLPMRNITLPRQKPSRRIACRRRILIAISQALPLRHKRADGGSGDRTRNCTRAPVSNAIRHSGGKFGPHFRAQLARHSQYYVVYSNSSESNPALVAFRDGLIEEGNRQMIESRFLTRIRTGRKDRPKSTIAISIRK